jgi:hypothetical protein
MLLEMGPAPWKVKRQAPCYDGPKYAFLLLEKAHKLDRLLRFQKCSSSHQRQNSDSLLVWLRWVFTSTKVIKRKTT